MAGSTKRIQASESHYGSSSNGGDDDDDDDNDDDDQSIGGGVFVEKEITDENSSRHGKEREFTGYDPQGNPHRMSIRTEAADPAEEAGSIHSGWAAWGVKSRDASDVARVTRKKEPKFAKIRVSMRDIRVLRMGGSND